jgi:hypothetical protein
VLVTRAGRLLLAAALALALVPAAAHGAALSTDDGKPGPGRLWRAGEIVLRLAPSVDEAERLRILSAAGVTPSWRMDLGMEVVFASRSRGMRRTVRALAATPGVTWAQPNVVSDEQASPPPPVNDPLYPGSLLRRIFFGDARKAQGQWALRRIGVDKAWAALKQPGRWLDTKVAVIDSGIDTLQPDLQGQFIPIARNTNYPAPAGTPAEDLRPVTPSAIELSHAIDERAHDHGTNVMGVIAAVADNKKGIAGVNPRTKVLALATDGIAMEAAAILYARDQGVKIINWSRAYTAYYDKADATKLDTTYKHTTHYLALRDAIHEVAKDGVLFVAASGNESVDVKDRMPRTGGGYSYPCHDRLQFPNLLCVAATDGSENLAYFSNWGVPEVQIAAPGAKILTTAWAAQYYEPFSDPSDWKKWQKLPYVLQDGTSFATPMVVGALSLLEACAGPELRQQATSLGKPYYQVLMDALELDGVRTDFAGLFGRTKRPLAGEVEWGGRLDVGQLFDVWGPRCSQRPAG